MSAVRGKVRTVAEVAEYLGVGRAIVRKFIASGELPARLDERGHYEIQERDLAKFIEARTVRPSR